MRVTADLIEALYRFGMDKPVRMQDLGDEPDATGTLAIGEVVDRDAYVELVAGFEKDVPT